MRSFALIAATLATLVAAVPIGDLPISDPLDSSTVTDTVLSALDGVPGVRVRDVAAYGVVGALDTLSTEINGPASSLVSLTATTFAIAEVTANVNAIVDSFNGAFVAIQGFAETDVALGAGAGGSVDSATEVAGAFSAELWTTLHAFSHVVDIASTISASVEAEAFVSINAAQGSFCNLISVVDKSTVGVYAILEADAEAQWTGAISTLAWTEAAAALGLHV